MSEDIKRKGLQSEERRRFLELSARFGVTTAIVALTSGALGSRKASAQVAGEEQKRKKAARHTMIVATSYVLGVSRSYPIMQLDYKENIQNIKSTMGKLGRTIFNRFLPSRNILKQLFRSG